MVKSPSDSEAAPKRATRKTAAKKTAAKKRATKKTAAKKTAAKKRAVKKTAAKKTEDVATSGAVDAGKSFAENLQASIDEENASQAQSKAQSTSKSKPKATGKSQGGQDIPVQSLFGGYQDKCERMLSDLPLPKCKFCEKYAEAKDVEVEDLGSGVFRALGDSPLGEVVEDVTALVRGTFNSVFGAINAATRKL